MKGQHPLKREVMRPKDIKLKHQSATAKEKNHSEALALKTVVTEIKTKNINAADII